MKLKMLYEIIKFFIISKKFNIISGLGYGAIGQANLIKRTNKILQSLKSTVFILYRKESIFIFLNMYIASFIIYSDIYWIEDFLSKLSKL